MLSPSTLSSKPLLHIIINHFPTSLGRSKNQIIIQDKLTGVKDGGQGSSPEEGGNSGTAETLLRLVPVALCVVALVAMLKDSQTNEFGSVSYSDLGAFKYLVQINGICAGYSLLAAVITAVPRPLTMFRAWTFFLIDQALTYLIVVGGAVSTEVVYLAYEGDEEITWSAACGTFSGLCDKATTSVILTFVVLLSYVVVSSYKLFTRFDSPHSDLPPHKAFHVPTVIFNA